VQGCDDGFLDDVKVDVEHVSVLTMTRAVARQRLYVLQSFSKRLNLLAEVFLWFVLEDFAIRLCH
jgi:hypothetical protein